MTDTEHESRQGNREQQILWMAGYKHLGFPPGSFYQHIINAFFAADKHNNARLEQAFPTTAKAFRHYMSGEMVDRHEARLAAERAEEANDG